MKTVDEIKRELEEGIRVHYHISDIEPRLTPLALHDLEFLHDDALALINRLQAENAEKDERIRELEAERDAAVADLKYIAVCETCKAFRRSALTEPCLHCTKYGFIDSENKYEWRGVRKEVTP